MIQHNIDQSVEKCSVKCSGIRFQIIHIGASLLINLVGLETKTRKRCLHQLVINLSFPQWYSINIYVYRNSHHWEIYWKEDIPLSFCVEVFRLDHSKLFQQLLLFLQHKQKISLIFSTGNILPWNLIPLETHTVKYYISSKNKMCSYDDKNLSALQPASDRWKVIAKINNFKLKFN